MPVLTGIMATMLLELLTILRIPAIGVNSMFTFHSSCPPIPSAPPEYNMGAQAPSK